MRFKKVPPGARVVGGMPEVSATIPPSTAKQRLQALGRLPTGTMNKTEAAYAAILEQGRLSGTVAWWKFEGIKLRLADNTFYTPDFNVMRSDGLIEMIETKGHWVDDARVKIKVAASIYPFRFVAVKAKAKSAGGGWEEEVFGE
jgi:hypothetical protein